MQEKKIKPLLLTGAGAGKSSGGSAGKVKQVKKPAPFIFPGTEQKPEAKVKQVRQYEPPTYDTALGPLFGTPERTKAAKSLQLKEAKTNTAKLKSVRQDIKDQKIDDKDLAESLVFMSQTDKEGKPISPVESNAMLSEFSPTITAEDAKRILEDPDGRAKALMLLEQWHSDRRVKSAEKKTGKRHFDFQGRAIDEAQMKGVQGVAQDVNITQAPGLLLGDILKNLGGGKIGDAVGQMVGSVPLWAAQTAEAWGKAKTPEDAIKAVAPVDALWTMQDPNSSPEDKGVAAFAIIASAAGPLLQYAKGEKFKFGKAMDEVSSKYGSGVKDSVSSILDEIGIKIDENGHAQEIPKQAEPFDPQKFTQNLIDQEKPLEVGDPAVNVKDAEFERIWRERTQGVINALQDQIDQGVNTRTLGHVKRELMKSLETGEPHPAILDEMQGGRQGSTVETPAQPGTPGTTGTPDPMVAQPPQEVGADPTGSTTPGNPSQALSGVKVLDGPMRPLGTDRDVVLVQMPDGTKQPFYRSTGHNSGTPGKWLPFDGIVDAPGTQLHGWFDKTRFTSGEFADPSHPLHRLGSQEMEAVSKWLGENDPGTAPRDAGGVLQQIGFTETNKRLTAPDSSAVPGRTPATYHGPDGDEPVVVTGVLGTRLGEKWYSVEGSTTGFPESRLTFDGEPPKTHLETAVDKYRTDGTPIPDDLVRQFLDEQPKQLSLEELSGSQKAKDEFTAMLDEIKADLGDMGGQVGSLPLLTPGQIRAVTKLPALVAKGLEVGYKTSVEFAQAMVEHFGEWIRSHAIDAWTASQNQATARHADLEDFAAKMGITLPSKDRVAWAQSVDAAIATGVPERAIDVVGTATLEKRPLNDVEKAGVVVRLAQETGEYNRLQKLVADGNFDQDLLDQMNSIFDRVSDLTTGLYLGGRASGRSLAMQKMVAAALGNQMDTPSLITRATRKVNLGAGKLRKLKPEELAVIRSYGDNYSKLAADLEKETARVQAEAAARALKETSTKKSAGPSDEEYAQAIQRLRSQRAASKRSGMATFPSDMSDIGIIVAWHLKRKVRDLDTLMEAVRKEIPDASDSEILSGFDEAHSFLYPGTKKVKKGPSIVDLRKQVKAARSTAAPGRKGAIEELDTMLQGLEDMVRAGIPYEQWRDAAKQVSEFSKKVNMGRKFGEDLLQAGNTAVESPKMRELRRRADTLKAEAERTFEQWRQKEEWENLTPWQQVIRTVVSAPNLLRIGMATGDDSFIGRQGWLMALANPKAGFKGFKEHYRGFKSQESFDAAMSDLRATLGEERWAQVEASGAFMLDPATGHEEHFQFGHLGKASRAVTKLAGPFERPYTLFGNVMRAHAVDSLAQGMFFKGGATAEELKHIGQFVNAMTGSVSMGKNASPLLSFVLWAPKFIASRARVAVPYDAAAALINGQPRAAAAILFGWTKSATAVATIGTLVNTWAKANNRDDVSAEFEDFTSADWGKVRIGELVFDITGGTGTYMRTVARLTSVWRANTGDKGLKQAMEELQRTGRYKISPWLDFLISQREGKNAIGQDLKAEWPINKLPMSQKNKETTENTLSHLTPFAATDARKITGEIVQGNRKKALEQGASMAFNLFGFGAQTYPKRRWKVKKS